MEGIGGAIVKRQMERKLIRFTFIESNSMLAVGCSAKSIEANVWYAPLCLYNSTK